MNNNITNTFQNAEPEESEEPRITPCPQMRTLLSQMADGTLRGLLGRYARAHVARCAHCQEALGALQRVVRHLRHLIEAHNADVAPGGLAPDRWVIVTKAMEEAEAQTGHRSA